MTDFLAEVRGFAVVGFAAGFVVVVTGAGVVFAGVTTGVVTALAPLSGVVVILPLVVGAVAGFAGSGSLIGAIGVVGFTNGFATALVIQASTPVVLPKRTM